MATFKYKIKNLEKELDRVTDEIADIAGEKLAAPLTQFYKNVKEATPVKTGRAKNSWEIEVITVDKSDKRKKEAKATVYNTAPYMEKLNAGSSTQAPPRFIEKEALKLFDPDGVIVQRSNRRS